MNIDECAIGNFVYTTEVIVSSIYHYYYIALHIHSLILSIYIDFFEDLITNIDSHLE